MIDNSKIKAGPNANKTVVSKNSVCTGAGSLTDIRRDIVIALPLVKT